MATACDDSSSWSATNFVSWGMRSSVVTEAGGNVGLFQSPLNQTVRVTAMRATTSTGATRRIQALVQKGIQARLVQYLEALPLLPVAPTESEKVYAQQQANPEAVIGNIPPQVFDPREQGFPHGDDNLVRSGPSGSVRRRIADVLRPARDDLTAHENAGTSPAFVAYVVIRLSLNRGH